MLSQTNYLRRWTTLAKALAALAVASLALPTVTHAVTITGFVDSPTSLSFNFSGTNDSDFIYNAIPSLVFWNKDPSGGEGHSASVNTGFGLYFDAISHPGAGAGFLQVAGAYGTTQSATAIVAHGAGFDNYSLTLTVNGSGTTWTSFSGSFSAVHRNAGVPDGGSTASLAGLALLALAGARRFFRTA